MRTKLIFTLLLLTISTPVATAQDGKQLVAEMIEAVGGKSNFYKLKNVNYDYEYRNPKASMTFMSHETYSFHGEKSHAEYVEHSVTAPKGGTVVEGFNGTDAWVSIDGTLTPAEQPNGFARFMRKTNYYWFSMFFKLLDEGVQHEFMGVKTVDEAAYNVVRVSFGENVGDAQDTYVLYINKKTKLVDRFLFTVMSFQMAEPQMMVLDYETVDGIKIGSKRKYIPADWKGNIKGNQWTTTNWTNIQFNTDVDQTMFEKPLN